MAAPVVHALRSVHGSSCCKCTRGCCQWSPHCHSWDRRRCHGHWRLQGGACCSTGWARCSSTCRCPGSRAARRLLVMLRAEGGWGSACHVHAHSWRPHSSPASAAIMDSVAAQLDSVPQAAAGNHVRKFEPHNFFLPIAGYQYGTAVYRDTRTSGYVTVQCSRPVPTWKASSNPSV